MGHFRFLNLATHGIDSHSGFSGMRDELSTQGSIQTPWFRTEKGCTGFPEQPQTFSRNQHRLLVQGMYGSEDARGLLQRSDRFTLRWSGRMEEEPPPWLISAILFAWAWVDTCHP
jgi:hypothetical protein